MSAPELKELTLEIINTCLQRCVHCSSLSCPEDNTFITTEWCEYIIKQCCALNNKGVLETINISGGEPFLHYDLLNVLKKCKNAGIPNIKLYSCGIMGTSDNPTSIDLSMFEKVKPYVNKIIMSIHGVGEMYNKITNTDDYFRIFEKSFSNCIKSGIPLECHFVPLTLNIDCFFDVCDYIRSKGINKISVLRYVPQGRGDEEDSEDLTPPLSSIVDLFTKIDEYLNEHKDFSIRRGHPWLPLIKFGFKDIDPVPEGGCPAGSSKLVITADGSILPCESFKYLIPH